MAVPADFAGVGVAEPPLDLVVGAAGIARQRGVGVPEPVKGGPGRTPGADRMRGRQIRWRQFAGLSTFPEGVVNSSPSGPGG
jgi:hypothetical protein